MRLKFDRLGCDPFDPSSPQNLAEQIDLHATCLTAIDGLEILMSRHTAESWILKPGHRSTGPDIESQEGEVAAEVFAAVRKSNNEKFVKDLYRIREFTGLHRYLIYRCPNEPESESEIDGVTVISLG
ncbi:MAG: hypothetical protein IPM23_18265 [Candidatus Melainabacteria bacterium]|nr:hypothetical protein [Candidatus Melainabacteria bacterium]